MVVINLAVYLPFISERKDTRLQKSEQVVILWILAGQDRV